MKARYMLERVTHGWLVYGAQPGGIRVEDLNEVVELMPEKSLMVSSVMAYHQGDPQNKAGNRLVFAICPTKEDAQRWEDDINIALARDVTLDPEQKWLRGTGTGRSSVAIFNVLSSRKGIETLSSMDWPSDAADFRRCQKLVDQFPGWRERLGEVAKVYTDLYPKSPWPRIIAEWDQLCALHNPALTQRLRELAS